MKTQDYVLTLKCPDRPGIVHDVSGVIVANQGNIIQSNQFLDPYSGLFCMRVHFAVDGADRSALGDCFSVVAETHKMDWELHDKRRKSRVLIMVSRFDHCLIDILYRQNIGELNIEVPAIVSNHSDVTRLAAAHGIPFHHIPVTKDSKPDAEAQVLTLIDEMEIDFVVLARYMQILSAEFCDQLAGRVINIHHSFLPGFKGARPYHQAHERGVKLIGATAHFATTDLDEGPIIEQDVQRVTHAHSVDELVAVGRDIETRVLGRAVKYLSEHRVAVNGARTVIFS
jgi:formyltetrahydrofolate deformylase